MQQFTVNDVEQDIIEKHMWPATRQMPHYKESYVIVIVDKYCAALEYVAPLFGAFSESISEKTGCGFCIKQ